MPGGAGVLRGGDRKINSHQMQGIAADGDVWATALFPCPSRHGEPTSALVVGAGGCRHLTCLSTSVLLPGPVLSSQTAAHPSPLALLCIPGAALSPPDSAASHHPPRHRHPPAMPKAVLRPHCGKSFLFLHFFSSFPL